MSAVENAVEDQKIGLLTRAAIWLLDRFIEAVHVPEDELKASRERIKQNWKDGVYDRVVVKHDEPALDSWEQTQRDAQAEYNMFGRASFMNGRVMTDRELTQYGVQR